MFGWLVAVVVFLGVILLVTLLASEFRLRQIQARHEHLGRRCLVASQLVAALRRGLTPPPPLPPPEIPEPGPSLTEASDTAVPAIVQEIELQARENPMAFGLAIQSLIRDGGGAVDPALAAAALAGSSPAAAT